MAGWNPATDHWIDVDDEIPEKPWLASFLHIVEGTGHCQFRFTSHTALLITHHSLSGVVQRWQARTLADLLKVIDTISTVALGYIAERQEKDYDNWHVTPMDGVRVPLPGDAAMLVLKQHETRRALVLATVF